VCAIHFKANMTISISICITAAGIVILLTFFNIARAFRPQVPSDKGRDAKEKKSPKSACDAISSEEMQCHFSEQVQLDEDRGVEEKTFPKNHRTRVFEELRCDLCDNNGDDVGLPIYVKFESCRLCAQQVQQRRGPSALHPEQ
jgi:hypothetical protein